MPKSALIGLAYLNVTWREEQRSYIENFLPMVYEVIKNIDDDIVTEPEVREKMLENFGLDVPQHTVGTLLRRAEQEGYLQINDYTFKPNQKALSQLDFSRHRERVIALYDDTLEKMMEFCQEQFGGNWGKEDVDKALQGYLSEYNLDVLLSVKNHSVVPKPDDASQDRLVASLFIRHLQNEDPQGFKHVMDLFRGAMLANALFVSDPSTPREQFSGTTFFLDSPLLLDALGYGFEDRVRPTQELINLLQDLGAELCAFQVTVKEAQGILAACAMFMKSGDDAREPMRGTIDYFYSEGMKSTDVHRKEEKLPKKLRDMGIKIHQRPTLDDEEWEYQVDTAGLEKKLEEDLHFQREKARRHDAEVISNIARLRRGQPQPSVETCEAIFVTHNSGLARSARDFFIDERLQDSIALVITDYHLTNIAWLKNPTETPELPLKVLLADCHAATQPTDELWESFLQEVEHLREQEEITVEEYTTLRYSQEVKTALSEVTLGDVEAISDGTVVQVLERAQREKHRELREEKHRRKEVEDRLQTRDRVDRKNLRMIATWTGRATGWVTVLLGLFLLGVGIFMNFPTGYSTLREVVPELLLTTVLAFMFFFLLWTAFYGTGWLHFANWIEEKIGDAVYRKLLIWWELESSDTGVNSDRD